MTHEETGRADLSAKSSAGMDAELQKEIDDALGGMSVEDLLAAEAAARPSAPSAGGGNAQLRKGRVIAIHGDDIFVDLGGKTQGVLPSKQFSTEEPLPGIGDLVEVHIDRCDDDGLLMLSRLGAVQEGSWDSLEKGQMVEGHVFGMNKGGLEIRINGIRAFMPISQVEMGRVEDLTPYLNQRLRCQVTEVDPAERNLVVSRKALLAVEAKEAKERLFETLTEGQTVRGTVKTIMPYGAFVDIGGADGLLHVKDMSHSRVDDPHTIVKEGQKLEVMVIKVDREERKIALGLKQVMPDPWQDVEMRFAPDSVVTGRVVRLADFGAFVEVETGVEGLVPISELTFERRVKHPSEVVHQGDVVNCRVLSVDPARKRLSLSIRKAGEDPWTGASVRWATNSIAEGVVKQITEFGAFVELAPGVQGLVHISELSGSRIRTVGDAVREGQLVQVKVLSVDEERRRISLSIKQAGESGAAAMTSSEAADQPPSPQPKRKKPLKGGLD